MKAAIACGGTGGHVYPGLATAEELQRRGHDVTLWMTGRETERPALQHWTGRVVEIPSKGFASRSPLKIFKTLLALLEASRLARNQMRQDRPDVLLAMGSYASAGPCRAAIALGIPLVLHEANVIPGRAVRFFAKRAAAVAVGFEETRHYLRRARVETVGIPLRADLSARASQPTAPRDFNAPPRLLVMGGSMGAHRLNEVAAQALVALTARGGSVAVTHLTGARDEASVRAAYAAGGLTADVRAFEPDMASLLASADFAICRAGASTCAELALFGLPALLVPYPLAAKDHQTANAAALERRGAADRIAESALDAAWLENYLAEMVHRPERIVRMREATRRNGLREGTSALADLVEQCAAQHHATPPKSP